MKNVKASLPSGIFGICFALVFVVLYLLLYESFKVSLPLCIVFCLLFFALIPIYGKVISLVKAKVFFRLGTALFIAVMFFMSVLMRETPFDGSINEQSADAFLLLLPLFTGIISAVLYEKRLGNVPICVSGMGYTLLAVIPTCAYVLGYLFGIEDIGTAAAFCMYPILPIYYLIFRYRVEDKMHYIGTVWAYLGAFWLPTVTVMGMFLSGRMLEFGEEIVYVFFMPVPVIVTAGIDLIICIATCLIRKLKMK